MKSADEQKLKFLEQFLDSSQVGVIVVDKNRINILVNNRLCEMFGYKEDELLGKSTEIFHVNNQHFLDFSKIAVEQALKGQIVELEYQAKHKNGELFWVLISGNIIKNKEEILWTMIDITKRIATQDKIKVLSERIELALLASNDGIWDWNLLDNSAYLSPRYKEMLGYEDSELENNFSTWDKLVHPDDKVIALQAVQDHIDKITAYYEGINRLKHKDGHWVWILNRGKAIYDDNGNAIRMIGAHTDITEQMKIQEQLKEQAQVIDQIQEIVVTTDLNGFILSWNHGAEILLGYSAKEVIGKHILIIHREEDKEEFKKSIEILMSKGKYLSEIYNVKKSKELVFISLSLSVLRDEYNNPIRLVGVAQDITKRKEAENELRKQKDILHYQAHHDSLTGLPNRILFNDRLDQAIQKAKRKDRIMALFFIDLDHFKEINDSLGHKAGDEVLKTVTSRLKKTIRENDTLARLGGDEFTIIIEDLTQGQDASFLAQKILDILALPIVLDENEFYVSSSIGISLYPEDGICASNLLKFADSAMYKAKAEGRNNFQYYSAEMTELAFERVLMETSLRTALDNEDFIVYYQPQVDGSNDSIIGMEALVRWNHTTMGIVSPAKFIPLAESTGLIVKLDRFVMKTAMKQFRLWYEKDFNPGVLALNLSIKQIQQKDFIEFLQNLLVETKCKPAWIELEVTEGQIMTNPQEAIKTLKKISELGIELAIDDFGTGYSSLAYLKKLPIDKLKIDQSFIRDLPDDEDDIGITKAVISLAKCLNLEVIAEGVETKAQKDFLIQNNCSLIQGYFYSKPVPYNEMEILLEKGLSV